MSSVDPRRLIPALQAYEEELGRWLQRMASTVEDAHFTHRHGTEAVRQGEYRLALEASRAQADEEQVRRAQEDHAALMSAAEGTLAEAQATSAALQYTAERALCAVHHWEAALRDAQVSLEAARAHLALTHRHLGDAEDRLTQAQRRLHGAEGELSECQSDSRSHDCSGPAAQVQWAQQAVGSAETAVMDAQREVWEAEAAVRGAVTRVDQCVQALGLARQADHLVRLTWPSANEAVSQAEQALASLHEASKHLSRAVGESGRQQQEGETGAQALRQCHVNLGEATSVLVTSGRHADDAAGYGREAGRELLHRQETLHELNRPDPSL